MLDIWGKKICTELRGGSLPTVKPSPPLEIREIGMLKYLERKIECMMVLCI